MRKTALAPMMGSALFLLAACGSGDTPPAESETEADPAATEESTMAAGNNAPDAVVDAGPDRSDLAAVLDAEWRGDGADRDIWRHPAQTLEFLQVDPSSTVVEIWPGGGWYTDILAPWIDGNGGTFVAAHFPADTASDYQARSRASFIDRTADAGIYGDIELAGFSETGGLEIEPGSADTILTFRNVHNWMGGGWAETAFAEMFEGLRPGGTLGVVEHRLPSTREQDPMAGTGYVQQDYVIALAEEAGFEFVAASEINANPADTADHPRGVWTLPPVRRNPQPDSEAAADFDREAYDAIGESDRMTLLFRKPDADTPESGDAD